MTGFLVTVYVFGFVIAGAIYCNRSIELETLIPRALIWPILATIHFVRETIEAIIEAFQ